MINVYNLDRGKQTFDEGILVISKFLASDICIDFYRYEDAKVTVVGDKVSVSFPQNKTERYNMFFAPRDSRYVNPGLRPRLLRANLFYDEEMVFLQEKETVKGVIVAGKYQPAKIEHCYKDRHLVTDFLLNENYKLEEYLRWLFGVMEFPQIYLESAIDLARRRILSPLKISIELKPELSESD